MNLFWLEHQAGVVVFLAVLVAIALSNLRALKRVAKPSDSESRVQGAAHRTPRVSILVPARNEEHNVAGAVRMLLAQEYPEFEVLVLDDCSTDNTATVLRSMSDPRLRVIRGKELPEGWLGKPWACQQLATEASGELLLFTDADTRHAPGTLRATVTVMENEKLDLLSVIPREETRGLVEKLVVPVVPWAIVAFLPLELAYRLCRSAFTAANGQFLMFRREAYERIGGHAAVRESVVDDLALVRRAARLGLAWRLYDAQDLVSCRMYRTSREVVEGFSKNLFGAFGFRILPFAFVWLWLAVVTFQPLVILGLLAAGARVPALSAWLAAAAAALALALWGISNVKFRFPWYVTLLYPVSTGLAIGIAIRSVVHAYSGRAEWKGRRLPRTVIRW